MGIVDYKIEFRPDPRLDAARMERITDEQIAAALTEAGQLFERLVKEETPLGATKLLRGSIFAEGRGSPIREMLVGSPLLHAPIVERGRQPGKMPPIGPIELWVRRKLGVEGDAARGVAFVVARKIARKGTKGAAMFFKAFEKGRPALERVAQRLGATVVADWEK